MSIHNRAFSSLRGCYLCIALVGTGCTADATNQPVAGSIATSHSGLRTVEMIAHDLGSSVLPVTGRGTGWLATDVDARKGRILVPGAFARNTGLDRAVFPGYETAHIPLTSAQAGNELAKLLTSAGNDLYAQEIAILNAQRAAGARDPSRGVAGNASRLVPPGISGEAAPSLMAAYSDDAALRHARETVDGGSSKYGGELFRLVTLVLPVPKRQMVLEYAIPQLVDVPRGSGAPLTPVGSESVLIGADRLTGTESLHYLVVPAAQSLDGAQNIAGMIRSHDIRLLYEAAIDPTVHHRGPVDVLSVGGTAAFRGTPRFFEILNEANFAAQIERIYGRHRVSGTSATTFEPIAFSEEDLTAMHDAGAIGIEDAYMHIAHQADLASRRFETFLVSVLNDSRTIKNPQFLGSLRNDVSNVAAQLANELRLFNGMLGERELYENPARARLFFQTAHLINMRVERIEKVVNSNVLLRLHLSAPLLLMKAARR